LPPAFPTRGARRRIASHEIAVLVDQRVFGNALSQEDMGKHDQLRHDPVLAVLASELEARHTGCALWPESQRRTAWSTRLRACRQARPDLRDQ
jgi:hypothetical protein